MVAFYLLCEIFQGRKNPQANWNEHPEISEGKKDLTRGSGKRLRDGLQPTKSDGIGKG